MFCRVFVFSSRRRHTRFDCDWSSDVCSSDLEAGVPAAPGTTLVTVSGAIERPGVYEIELGTPIGEVIRLAGGPAERPQAVLTGGYFGTWLTAEVAWTAPMSHPGLRSVGAAMGAGILIVLPEWCCGLA